ncbi:MAG: 23S rRNA (uracil(1939)-C(5))-methyltransferase RlmD [Deltaproteobacteria bacterium]|nr:MAG: 23S rRNA (uracil(1939)-C(5))-methyltransferase RlmD [Deltaproteobacteria bacterium]
MTRLKKGMEIELEVEALAFGGRGLARVNGFVVFIDRALPGQRVLARIIRKKSSYAQARIVDVLEESPKAIAPRCVHFGTCGGCLWQNFPYHEQLQAKRDLVWECLAHIGNVSEDLVLPTLPSPEIYYYRNKMEFSFANRRWLQPEELELSRPDKPRDFALGLHVKGFYDRVLDIEECHLQNPLSVAIVKQVRRFVLASGLASYNTRDHTGFWRFLVVRDSKHNGEILVELITASHRRAETVVAQLASGLQAKIPQVSTLVHGISGKKAQIASAETQEVIFGRGHLEEQLGELRFRVSPEAFFQTNSKGAKILLEEVAAGCSLSGSELVWDLYCGTGTIAIGLAKEARKVIGFELVDQALADARVNVRLNRVDNCAFVSGDMKTLLSKPAPLIDRCGRPDVVVTDPPRAGMHPSVVNSLVALGPARMVCVSCNPATLARDLKMMTEKYRLLRVQPVDLFPHTPHIEAVAVLERKN